MVTTPTDKTTALLAELSERAVNAVASQLPALQDLRGNSSAPAVYQNGGYVDGEFVQYWQPGTVPGSAPIAP